MIDGQADYTGYTQQQLIDALAAIDPRKYPQDYAKLRQALGMPPSAITTPADQLLPWQGPWYFAVSPMKLLVMEIATVGFYQLYWFYKHWALVRDRERSDIWPVARAIFGVLFVWPLFDHIRKSSQDQLGRTLPAGLLAIAWIVTTITWRLPDPWWLITYLSVFPMLPIQVAANRVNAKVDPQHDQNQAYSIWNKVGIAVGFPLFALMLFGIFGSDVTEQKPEPRDRSEKVVMNEAGR